MSSAVRWILQSGDRPTSVSSRFTAHRFRARFPLRNSSVTGGRVRNVEFVKGRNRP